MKRRRRFVYAGLALLAGGSAYAALRPEAVDVETARAVRGPMRVSVEGLGKTRVRTRFVVLALASGELERISLVAGDPIAAGQPVAMLRAAAPSPLDGRTRAELHARLAGARAAEAEATAALDRARVGEAEAARELERAATLATLGSLTAREHESAAFGARARGEERRMAEATLRRATSERQAAEAMLADVESVRDGRPSDVVPVRSPASGRVLRVLRSDAGPVAAGTPLLEVGDPVDLESVVDLLTTDAVRVSPGDPVELTGWGREGILRGTVERIEPSAFTKISALGVEEQRVNVIVVPAAGSSTVAGPASPAPAVAPTMQNAPAEEAQAATAPWAALGDGFAVDARIVVAERASAVKVPASALVRYGERWAVYAVDDGIARLAPVELGARSAAESEVLRGVHEGTSVVLYPSDRLADGTRVKAR